MYQIWHNSQPYIVILSGKLCALSCFRKGWLEVFPGYNPNITKIKGEIACLTNFSKIAGGKYIYSLIMEHIADIDSLAS